MSNPAGPARPLRFRLRSKPPIRTYLQAAVAAMVGAVLLVLASEFGWPVGVAVLGGVLLAAGVILAAVAVVVHNVLQTTIMVGADELTLLNPGRRRVLPWSEIEQVGTAGPRLIFSRSNGRRTVVLFDPKQAGSALFREMVLVIQRRLDDSRGYDWLTD